MRSIILLVLLTMLASPVVAGERGGVTMRDTVEVAGKRLTLNGMGVREATILDIDVYVAGLYLERVSSNAAAIVSSKQTKVLVLRFVRDVDRGDIVKAWRDGFKNNATVPLASIQGFVDQLTGWMGDFSNGDTLTFTFVPDQGVFVDINGTRKGTIESEDFAQSLLAIWLGPKPPNGGLKTGLLGRHGAGS